MTHTRYPPSLIAGFTGYLILPPEIVVALRLPQSDPALVTLGDGTESMLERFLVKVSWGNEERTVFAYQADGIPAIGMHLLQGMTGTIHFADGGTSVFYRS